jgi:YggT family protein
LSDYQQNNDVPVDRRAETVVTQQAGYAATEQVVRDVAAERRLWSFQINRILWTVLGILEIMLGLRFVLKLIAANPESGFSVFVYGFTGAFMAPFNALLGTPSYKGAILEANALVAMAVYALLFWVIARIIQIAVDRPTSRTVTRSTRG